MGFFDFMLNESAGEEAKKKKCCNGEDEVDEEFSEESEKVVKEAYIIEATAPADVEKFKNSEEREELEEEGVVTERTIIKMDKKGRMNQLEKVAILQLAREKDDKLFKKFVTLKKAERLIETKLEAKYASKAKALAKKMMVELQKKKK